MTNVSIKCLGVNTCTWSKASRAKIRNVRVTLEYNVFTNQDLSDLKNIYSILQKAIES